MVKIDTALPPPHSRTNLEEAAYVVVDLQYPPPPKSANWRQVRLGKSLTIDFAETGEPVLVELREPTETWGQVPALTLPEVRHTGTARILTARRLPLPVTVSSDTDRTLVHVSWGFEGPDEFVRIASGLVFELAHMARVGPTVLSGRLAGLWVSDVPRMSPADFLLRAIRVVGPPIGGEAVREASNIPKPVPRVIAPDPRRRH